MKIVFRVDSSLIIGTGHTARCLTLADTLREKGSLVSFIIREHDGNQYDLIKEKGYSVFLLTNNRKIYRDTKQKVNLADLDEQANYTKWLGLSWEEDAEQTKNILENIKPDWLIVDHYSIDWRWEEYLKPYYKKIMVIDDLANRKHDCNLLLDQTFGRLKNEYLYLTPNDATILLGSKFALLRPEFNKWRKYSLERRKNPVLKNILLSLGGVDIDNFTEKILAILDNINFQVPPEICVVIGKTSPHIESIKNKVSKMKYQVEVLIGISNMAELMANTDFSIGSAGTTAWERCCLGVPSAMLILADNQKTIANNIHKNGAAILIDQVNQEKLSEIMRSLNSKSMKIMASCGSQMVDGLGVQYVADKIYTL